MSPQTQTISLGFLFLYFRYITIDGGDLSFVEKTDVNQYKLHDVCYSFLVQANL